MKKKFKFVLSDRLHSIAHIRKDKKDVYMAEKINDETYRVSWNFANFESGSVEYEYNEVCSFIKDKDWIEIK